MEDDGPDHGRERSDRPFCHLIRELLKVVVPRTEERLDRRGRGPGRGRDLLLQAALDGDEVELQPVVERVYVLTLAGDELVELRVPLLEGGCELLRSLVVLLARLD